MDYSNLILSYFASLLYLYIGTVVIVKTFDDDYPWYINIALIFIWPVVVIDILLMVITSCLIQALKHIKIKKYFKYENNSNI